MRIKDYHQLVDELSKGTVFIVFTTHHDITVHKNTWLNGAYFISDENDICGNRETHHLDELLKKVKSALSIRRQFKMQISDFTDKHADALIQLVQEEKIAPNDAIAKISKVDHEQLTRSNLL